MCSQRLAFIKRKWNSLFRRVKRPIHYLNGMKWLSEMRKEIPTNTICLICTNLLGDTIYGLAYVDEVKRKYPDHKIWVICAKKNAYFLKNYKSVDRMVYFSDLSESNRKGLVEFIWSSKASETGLKENIINTTTCFYRQCYNAENPDSLYQLRTHILDIGGDSRITYPVFDDVEITAITDFEQDKHRIAVLNPYSNSLAGARLELFEKIVEVLKKRGCRLFTNAIGDQEPLAETERLNCSIEELFAICRHIPLVVSIRSGVLDAVVSSNVNMFVIYDQVDSKWLKIFTVESWKCKGRIREVQTSEGIETCYGRFEEFLKEIEEA